MEINANRRRPRLAAKYAIDAMHMVSKSIRRYVAVEIETPAPVTIAIYVARHAGHFGSSTKPPAGSIHPAISRHRRANGFLLVTVTDLFAAPLSQQRFVCIAIPLRADPQVQGASDPAGRFTQAVVVLVVALHPVSQIVIRTRLVTALRRQVEKHICA